MACGGVTLVQALMLKANIAVLSNTKLRPNKQTVLEAGVRSSVMMLCFTGCC